MTLLPRKVDYALLILWYLHHRADGGCARTIAQRFGLSQAFVANILKELCQQELVVSHRGVKGGYRLRRPAAEITLASLMEALDDTFRLTECCTPDPAQGCTLHGICPIKGPVADIHRRIRDLLGGVTLAELFSASAPTPESWVELNLTRCQPS
jgi:Rrf2 family protein